MAKKRMTAAELMAALTTPEFVAARKRDEEERQRHAAECRLAEAPLLDDLRAAGFELQSVWDLVNTRGSYPRAVPILLSHLQRPYSSVIRNGIARALAVPEAIVAWDLLKRLYREEQDEDAKDGLAVTLLGAATEDVVDDVIALARDPSLGSSRLFLLIVLERSKNRRARAALMSLGTDPDLTKEVQAAMKRIERKNVRRARRAEQRTRSSS